MRVLKTKTFARWARKDGPRDSQLMRAIEEMQRGLVDADLGGGLFKQRVARSGAGKSGGYRTLLASNRRDRWVFLFGFGKNERGNIDDKEESDLRRVAGVLLGSPEIDIVRLIEFGELLEAKGGKSQAS